MYKNVDVLLSAARTLIEDVRTISVAYKEAPDKKKKGDETLFKDIETSINTFQEKISKVAANSGSLISDVNVKKDVSTIEAGLKYQIAPILDLVLCLPMNDLHAKQVSRGEKKVVRRKLKMNTKAKL